MKNKLNPFENNKKLPTKRNQRKRWQRQTNGESDWKMQMAEKKDINSPNMVKKMKEKQEKYLFIINYII